jgi:cytochrome c-type biogenesis protein CcmH/NrfG
MSTTRFTILFGVILVLCCGLSVAQAAADKPQQIAEHSRRAQEFLREKKPDLAIPELQAIVALDPNDRDTRANLGVLLFFQGGYAQAVPQLRAAFQLKPDLWKIQALLGLAEMRLKDTSTARADLESALPHLPVEKIQAETGYALIESYTSTGELEKAANTVSILLASQPTDPRLLLMSYRLYSDLASNAMVTLALAAPQSAEMHQAMGRELARQGNEAAAVANYRQAIESDPKLPGLSFDLGNLLYNSSDEKLQAEAEAQFQAALAANPLDEKAQLMLGEIAARRGDMKAAYEDDAHAVEMQPNDPEACSEFAKILMSSKEPEKARSLLVHALEIDPMNYTAHYRLSTLDRQQGKPEEAKRELAEYEKYKAMKDKLRSIFHDMRAPSDEVPEGGNGMSK